MIFWPSSEAIKTHETPCTVNNFCEAHVKHTLWFLELWISIRTCRSSTKLGSPRYREPRMEKTCMKWSSNEEQSKDFAQNVTLYFLQQTSQPTVSLDDHCGDSTTILLTSASDSFYQDETWTYDDYVHSFYTSVRPRSHGGSEWKRNRAVWVSRGYYARECSTMFHSELSHNKKKFCCLILSTVN